MIHSVFLIGPFNTGKTIKLQELLGKCNPKRSIEITFNQLLLANPMELRGDYDVLAIDDHLADSQIDFIVGLIKEYDFRFILVSQEPFEMFEKYTPYFFFYHAKRNTNKKWKQQL